MSRSPHRRAAGPGAAAGPDPTLTIGAVVARHAAGPGSRWPRWRSPGWRCERTVVAPAPTGPVDAYAFDASPRGRGCVDRRPRRGPRCAAALVRGARRAVGLDRAFATGGPADYELAATALPRPGPASTRCSPPARGGPRAAATSARSPDPRGGPAAAVDGDPPTAWLAGRDDEPPDAHPDLARAADDRPAAGRRRRARRRRGPTAVTVDDGGRARTVPLDADGTARFAPVVTDRLELTCASP